MKDGIDSIRFRITGVSPLIMHSGRLADPLDPASEAIKAVPVGKRATKADMKRKSELELLGSLYLDSAGKIVIPANNLIAVLIEGAKRDKRGKEFSAGTYIEEDALLEYDGPPAKGLFKEDRFVLRLPVKQGMSRIIRTRPIFMEWAATFEVLFDTLQVDRKSITAAITVAGERIGLGDWRPRYGRFSAKEVAALKVKKAA
jgi:hypothetical protein